MRAVVLERHREPLRLQDRPVPSPGPGEVRITVEACAVCRTDLHVIDGELPGGTLPIVLGHQIAGIVEALGAGVTALRIGDRVGVPWLGWADGTCTYCTSGRENLCRRARFTGFHRDGGFADACVADARFTLRLPPGYSAPEAAPLLCGALIGYRALRLAGDGHRLGLYGFGSAGHLIAQVAIHLGREVYAFTRPGDDRAQEFARDLGAVWAGDSTSLPPSELDAAIIFAPVGDLVPLALTAVAPGGTVVCGGIHMSDIPSFPYRLLWEERTLRSVANLTRRDGEELLALAPKIRLHPRVVSYRLEDANRAVDDLRAGRFDGSAVLVTQP
ncbi:MAG: zinc-dependent alcohol dehydrogenase family protein [Deltaproteobacteria bacterium]|nr:zinc-dependent alcohol dehydrogenase family protein [Deltaproteobacteria bacterium]MCW5803119.1 zinc-dependent alcohol dehydrogenase family protein [Deltaproteobacteria bacterium]